MANTYATLNPADKGGNTVLSGGDLKIAVSPSGYQGSRSTIGVSSGKWYWEVVATGTSIDSLIGVCNSSASLTTFVGGDVNGWGYYPSGLKFTNGGSAAYGASYAIGDVIGVALDMDAGTLIFYKNNTSQGTAYTGLTGTLYANSTPNNSTYTLDHNFGATALTYSPPAGYNAGLYTSTGSTFSPRLSLLGVGR